jgi:hypothetical protein
MLFMFAAVTVLGYLVTLFQMLKHVVSNDMRRLMVSSGGYN